VTISLTNTVLPRTVLQKVSRDELCPSQWKDPEIGRGNWTWWLQQFPIQAVPAHSLYSCLCLARVLWHNRFQ